MCARVGTNRLLQKLAHGLNDLQPLPIGVRAGPTVEFRAMYQLAILLTCLRKAALEFVDDFDETVGHIHTFAGGFCEGTLREWNATCLVAWSKQTGRPDPTPLKTAAPVKYRASGSNSSSSNDSGINSNSSNYAQSYVQSKYVDWMIERAQEIGAVAFSTMTNGRDAIYESLGGAQAALDGAGIPYMPDRLTQSGVSPSAAAAGLTLVAAAYIAWAASRGNAKAGTQRHSESKTIMILYDNFIQDHTRAPWWDVESMDPVRVPSDMRGYHELLARKLAIHGTSIPGAGESSGDAMTLM